KNCIESPGPLSAIGRTPPGHVLVDRRQRRMKPARCTEFGTHEPAIAGDRDGEAAGRGNKPKPPHSARYPPAEWPKIPHRSRSTPIAAASMRTQFHAAATSPTIPGNFVYGANR